MSDETLFKLSASMDVNPEEKKIDWKKLGLGILKSISELGIYEADSESVESKKEKKIENDLFWSEPEVEIKRKEKVDNSKYIKEQEKLEKQLKKEQIKQKQLMNKLQNKKESTISKINVKSNNKYAFQNTNRTETKIEKMVRKGNENVIKMQNRADNIYGSDEEYQRKYPDSFKNKKHNYFETLRDEKQPIQYQIPDISNPDKLFFKNGMMGDRIWEQKEEKEIQKVDYAWDKKGNIVYDKPQPPLPFVEKQKRNLLALGVNIYDWLDSNNEYYYKQRVNTLLGLATIPIGGGAAITANIAKPLVPIVGKKIATNIASGVAGGLIGGAVEGFGRGVIEGENPLKTMTQDALLSGAVGGLGGFGLGKLAKGLEKQKILENQNNTEAVQEYVDNYLVDVLNSNKTDLRDLRQFRTSKDIGIGTRDWFFDSINDEDFDYEKVMKLAKDLKSPKQIAPTLKSEGEVVIMKGSEPFKKGEIEFSISEITSNMSKEEIEKGYATRNLTIGFIRLKYDKNGKHTIGKFNVNERLYDENR